MPLLGRLSLGILPVDFQIDNRQNTVADYLRGYLSHADAFDFVSAYFSIYGYELSADK